MGKEEYLIKEEFLEDKNVNEFCKWIIDLIDKENNFKHEYTMLRPNKVWTCSSIYNAYEKYEWKNQNYDENRKNLKVLSCRLKKSIKEKNEHEFMQASIDVLKWGGVYNEGNKNYLLRKKRDYFKDMLSNIRVLKKDNLNLNDLKGIRMNAGFSKIYSLILDDFIIYDSRVSTALCFLISIYLEEKGFDKIPENLNLRYAADKGTNVNRRDPSTDRYRFCKIYYKIYSQNNIKANWLLKAITDGSKKFREHNDSMRRLEAALFMIGYDISKVELVSGSLAKRS